MPQVSILMAVFDEAWCVKRSIDSIINQTFTDWELLVIDDGSIDSTVDMVKRMAENDYRIRLIEGCQNRGLAVRLNEGIDMTGGEFLARMDADDEMLPGRLQTQVAFFRLNLKTEVLGGAAILVDDKSYCVGKATVPESHEDIRSMMPFRNPVIHSTIMVRREVFKDNRYSPACRRNQDYELWSRLIDQARFHNLQEPLIKYYVNNRKKTWESIGYDFFVHMLVVIRLHSVRGMVRPFTIFVRNLMVKSGLYTPQSSRPKKL